MLPDGSVRARRTDGADEQLTVRADRLLAAEHGDGAHYRFVGWVSRSYRTWACVVDRTESQVVLTLPEWHPAYPVCVAERVIADRDRGAERVDACDRGPFGGRTPRA